MKKFMKNTFDFIIKFRIAFLILWGLLIVGSLVLIPLVKINYDTTKYLPDDVRIKESLKIMEEEFGLTGQASIMIENVEIADAILYKKQLAKIDGIMDIMWLDSFVDGEVLNNVDQLIKDSNLENIFGLESIPGLDQFYKNKSALFQVIFEESEHDIAINKPIEEIRDFLERANVSYAMAGTAISTYNTREMTKKEVFTITLYVLPIILIILIIFSNSWAEPFLFLIVVGASVLVNMGTNFFFKEISFLTNSTASLLQLAISMDYSIFLLHQYKKQRENGLEPKAAMSKAMQNSFLSINSSMLTTVAGFAALMFMRYTIGIDLSMVMIKGILLSIICVFTFMPALIITTDKLLVKTEHRPFFPSLKGFSKVVYKARFLLPMLALLVLIPAYTTQANNAFVYGEDEMGGGGTSGVITEAQQIENTFGKSNMIVVLVPNDDQELELSMTKEMQKKLKPYNGSIQSLAVLSDISGYISDLGLNETLLNIITENFPKDWILDQIPQDFKDQLVSENYSRIIISVNTDTESPEAFEAVKIIETTAVKFYRNDYHIIGVSSSVKEIKTVVESDYVLINIFSIGLVLLILILTFRSAIIPVVLVLVIQLSIWINMSIPYLTGEPLIFIGYMIVSAIQLGATIDYGILLTHSYLGARKTMNKGEAMKYAIVHSGNSILTSSLILTTAGFALQFVSSVDSVGALGGLIGRGAFLSGFLTLFLLPQALYLLDKWIGKTTYKSNFYLEPAFNQPVNDEFINDHVISVNGYVDKVDNNVESMYQKLEKGLVVSNDGIVNLNILLMKDLRDFARDRKITGFSTMRKDELVRVLPYELEKLRVVELKAVARECKIPNFSTMNKEQLLEAIKPEALKEENHELEKQVEETNGLKEDETVDFNLDDKKED